MKTAFENFRTALRRWRAIPDAGRRPVAPHSREASGAGDPKRLTGAGPAFFTR